MKNQRCGYIAIVGRPNVGKSTFLNCILGKKISITSPKPQTTRDQIIGIKTLGTDQALFIDTPGLHKDEPRAMNRYLNRLASSVILDADVVLFMIEAPRWYKEDDWILEKLKDVKAPVILVINKIDLLKEKGKLLPFIDEVKNKYDFNAIVPVSVKKLENINVLLDTIMDLLPVSPHLFPDEQLTDKTEKFQVGEMIREKLIQATEQEVPYSTMVEIESLTRSAKLIDINAIIWVEREGQKPIVIGKNGERLKEIGTLARKDIEKLLGQKVFLRLWVKVKDDWTDSEKALKSLGYE